MISGIPGWKRYLHMYFLAWLVLVSGLAASAEQSPMGYFEVTSNPQGADVLVDGMFTGETPVIVPVQSAGLNGSVIRVIMQGFQPWEKTFPRLPLPGEVVPVEAVLVPVSTVGSLKVSSSPSGAMVTVNNANGQMTPWTYQNLPAGPHLVSLFLLGFEPYVRTVEIQPGKVTDLAANMSIRTGAGTLEISSDPGGATAYIDGVYAGVTNLVVGNVAPGRHEVRISRAGSEDYVVWAEVENKVTTPVHASLAPVSSVSGGSVVVTSDPPGASVYLDGTFSGITETGRLLEITNVTPGSHRIYVSSKNYQDYEAVVMVSAGGITPVSVQMNPSPMPQSCGLLILNSEPSGADIAIDGQLRGKTPATIETVCSGRHTFSLTLSGYQNYQSTFEIIPGQVLQMNTVLSPVQGEEKAGSSQIPWPSPVLIAVTLGVFCLVIAGKRK
jgi:hypothetical protein